MKRHNYIWWGLATCLIGWGLWATYGNKDGFASQYFADKDERIGQPFLKPDLLEDLISVRLKNADGTWHFSKGKDNRFWLQEPLSLPVDREVLQTFLTNLQQSKVLEKVDDNWQERFGLGMLKVEVTTGRGAFLQLHVGKKHPLGGNYIAFGNHLQVYRGELPAFPTDVFDWLDTQPLRQLNQQAHLCDIGFGLAGSLRLLRPVEHGSWLLNAQPPRKGSLDSDKVDSLLDRLSQLAFGNVLIKNDTRVRDAMNHARFYQIKTFHGEVFQIWLGQLTPEDTLADRPIDFLAFETPPQHLYHALGQRFIFVVSPLLLKDLPYFPLDFSLKKRRLDP